MARAGLTPDVVIRSTAALIDREGLEAVTLARVARDLGVRPPSLYNHVAGRRALIRLVAIDGVARLADACRSAAMGLAGVDGLRAIADAYRAFAVAHPGVYVLTQRARPGDAEYEAGATRLLEAVFAVLSGLGLPDADLVHATRAVRSALHGFVVLEAGAGFGMDVDVDDSFEWLVAAMVSGLLTAAS